MRFKEHIERCQSSAIVYEQCDRPLRSTGVGGFMQPIIVCTLVCKFMARRQISHLHKAYKAKVYKR
jgi:hypothetical protein